MAMLRIFRKNVRNACFQYVDKIDFSVNTYGRASLNSKDYAYLSIISVGLTRQLD